MPFLPAKLLMKDQYRSDQALKDLDMPLIWLHGTADEVISLKQGQKLYDGYSGPKSAHIIEGRQAHQPLEPRRVRDCAGNLRGYKSLK